jgi:hypothetical protein
MLNEMYEVFGDSLTNRWLASTVREVPRLTNNTRTSHEPPTTYHSPYSISAVRIWFYNTHYHDQDHKECRVVFTPTYIVNLLQFFPFQIFTDPDTERTTEHRPRNVHYDSNSRPF